MKESNVKNIETIEKKDKRFDKKYMIILIVIFVLVVLILFLSKKPRLESDFKHLGKDFYSGYYYKQISKSKTEKEVKSFLDDFKEIGIKVSLANIETYNGKGNEKIIKKLKSAKCDENKSVVTIYPKKPYGKNDFTVKVKLSCK